jgi:pimeloyl-ACP methyl ester carboxylesterase
MTREQALAWLRDRVSEEQDARAVEQVSVERFVEVPGGAVRLLHHRPEGASGRPVLIVPGFGAITAGWQEVYQCLHDRAEFVVLETLEKSTTRLDTADPDLSIESLAEQLRLGLEGLGWVGRDFVMMGSSWGGTTLLWALKLGMVAPPTTVVVDPLERLIVPEWVLRDLVPLLPIALVDALRSPIAWVMLRNMNEPRQRARAEAFIEAADPLRWMRAIQQSWYVHLLGEVGEIDHPVIVLNGTHDGVHDAANAPRIARELPAGSLLHCPVEEHLRERMIGVMMRELTRVEAGEPLPEPLRALMRDPDELIADLQSG